MSGSNEGQGASPPGPPLRTRPQTPLIRHARLLLLTLCLLFYLPGQTKLPPGDRDESRFAQATKQMIQSGDYVRIMNGKAARNRKPVGIYWLQAPFALAARAVEGPASNPIWPYRLPSLLGAIAAVLATFETALALTADRRAAILAGGMLASCVILTVEAHIAKTDAALLGATTWAMAMLARAWMGKTLGAAEAAVFWLALGLGILIKGPIAPLVAGLCALTLSLWRPAPHWRWLHALRPAWGIPLMALVVLPWFVAIQLATHGAFLAQSVGGDLASKVAGGSETHGGLPGEHLLLLPLLAFPSSLAVFAAFPGAWAARTAPATRFLLAWIMPSWLVFELTPTKLPHYTLPLYPALFILAASWHLGSVRAVPSRVLSALSRGGLCMASALLGAGGLALAIALDGPWWLALPALPAAGAAAWFARNTNRGWQSLARSRSTLPFCNSPCPTSRRYGWRRASRPHCTVTGLVVTRSARALLSWAMPSRAWFSKPARIRFSYLMGPPQQTRWRTAMRPWC